MSSRNLLSIAITVTLALAVVACENGGVDDAELGLSKDSVFSTPDPLVAVSSARDPGENETREAYFAGAPPLIPHAVGDYLPIKIDENMCLDCHALPEMIGQVVDRGNPTPIPASHYTDLRRSPSEVTDDVIGARFVCTQCHVPQLDVEPLVANTYGQ